MKVLQWDQQGTGARFTVLHNGRVVRGHASRVREGLRIWVDGQVVDVGTSGPRPQRGVPVVSPEPRRKRFADVDGESVSRAEFPCLLIEMSVVLGERVSPGQRLYAVESMKMQEYVTSSGHGTVSRICARVGDAVDTGDAIIVLETP